MLYYCQRMKTVGDGTPPIYWADEISVSRSGPKLIVRGIRHLPPRPETFERRDLVGRYVRASAKSSREKGGANNAPHVRFARADTHQKLQAFVATCGPVCPDASSVELRLIEVGNGSLTEIVAIQDLLRLQRERNTFLAATELMNAVRDRAPSFNRMIECASKVWEGTIPWSAEWEEEERCRRKFPDANPQPWIWNDRLRRTVKRTLDHCNRLRPQLKWCDSKKQTTGEEEMLRTFQAHHDPPDSAAKAIIDPCHELLCSVLNGFPVYATRWEGMSLEFPSDVTAFGIRPALYYLLRCDYFADVHIALCPWRDCPTKWFRQSRRGQIFCSQDCERRNRQRTYYVRKGKETKSAYYQNTTKRRRRAKSREKEIEK